MFSHDQKKLYSGSEDGSIYEINIAGGKIEKDFHSLHIDAVNSIALHPKKAILATGSSDSTVKLLDMTKREVLHSFINVHMGKTENFFLSISYSSLPASVNVVLFTSDGKTLLTASSDRYVKVIDVETRKITHSFDKMLKRENYLTWQQYINSLL